ncbi:Membrane fusogenic activity [Legionella birminghamensis]|uniref:Ubiquinone biosynthesis accessory factor UbiK n=1 Tax=Legionella birminghamensis TaxID=28083 RepID=A0A378I8M1_9GAMM|nr:accessory factor UbiK family protein [Legionella birminghamensis]KTC68134.1 Membrane fusogenic activity [Legionella birminghamensis]STX31156.1 Uncharacterized protein conserved in bacteria [Legionella birminghamensis]
MFDPKYFDELAKKLFSSLPSSIQNLEKDIEDKFKEILQVAFNRLDLITREEFDVQTKVLARTREKLEALEAQVNLMIKLQTNNKDQNTEI